MKRLFFSAAAFMLLLATSLAAPGSPDEEQQFIAVLRSHDATPAEKDAACAGLKRIGTVKSVAALSSLLTDEQLSHSARYALESMSTPAAGRALREALGKTKGSIKAGIIISLGARGEVKAEPSLAKALRDSDVEVASAAATALGQIGDARSVKALRAALKVSQSPAHDAVVDGLLRVAGRLLTSHSPTKALPIFQQLYNATDKNAIRVAAYRGMVLASGEKGLPLLTQALAGQPSPQQTAAIQLVHELDVPGATEAIAKFLPQAGYRVQVDLIEGLSQRDDPAARPAVAAAAGSADPEVCEAALTALGGLGDASVIPLLAQAAASASGAEQDAARESLARLWRGQPGEAMLSQLGTARPEVQAELARALGARTDTNAIPNLLELASQASGAPRKAALEALALLADQSQLGALVRLVVEAKDDTARVQAAEALNSACQHIQSKSGRVNMEPLIAGLGTGPAGARIALLPICGGFVDPQIRAALRAAIADPDPQVRAAAVGAMCDTTDPELLPDMVKLACEAPEENLRDVAIRGCVRLTTDEDTVKLSNSIRIDALEPVLANARSAEEKRQVLAGLARISDPAALKLVEPLLNDPAVQREASAAVIQIAPQLTDASASAALKEVLSQAQDDALRHEAEAALKVIEAGSGFITSWQVAGPYRQPGKDYAALFDIVFPPETAGAESVGWKALNGADIKRPWLMDLLKALGSGEECVAYARTRVHCDRQQAVRLEIGSDDGVKVWFNDRVVLANNVARSLHAGSDKVNLTLKAGWNVLLLKVTQHNKGWVFCARLINADGSLPEGLRIDAEIHAGQSNAARPGPRGL